MKKGSWITILIVLGVLALSLYLITKDNFNPNNNFPNENLVKCIASKSILYVQEGCIHCKNQEELFGDNYKFLNKFDCTQNFQLCLNEGIYGTPTWVIDNQKYAKVLTIEELKQMTGC